MTEPGYAPDFFAYYTIAGHEMRRKIDMVRAERDEARAFAQKQYDRAEKAEREKVLLNRSVDYWCNRLNEAEAKRDEFCNMLVDKERECGKLERLNAELVGALKKALKRSET